ncbi:pyridoxamine 5'-phosphate oxidase family protein [Cytobacillus purgationiresistens]|uniref:Nitroimidazol reductase NimA-like FMN-containing flavoprotein (Pyridoxamine 5'-phosphate oxidase superfamily) n=1 Tax=Cytobacillus purgationiresistens TaxID=863449 RepID=A0ABU0AAV5_9BACI|nr:pyridoxamine 5'-phosphate oxidase family protein [Cytobacillus purgationiresistens]MDQ0268393.1 nitroimidazol reductase NimA-like FMN-containing flavoprotein (pyridoxamine 5'-phosphate oxidase superfamily) [Cytobacillus purgationiresistens]
MRQEKLKWAEQPAINEFIKIERTGYLGLTDGENPYVIPLNYVWLNDSIYIHGAAEGRKIDIVQENSSACFTISRDLGTMTSPIPAKTDTAYKSVIVFGEIHIVKELKEAHEVMEHFLNKYVPGYYDQPLSKTHVEKYRSSLGSKTVVLKLTPRSISAKANHYDEAVSFYPGRQVKMDLGK